MFERYTEKARRTVFFARYEASQYGSPTIETEHLLLGLLREDHALAIRVIKPLGGLESIREDLEKHITPGKPISTSVEVPLSSECKRILHRAGEEAERLAHKHVGTEHLLLGILGEKDCLAAQTLTKRGLDLAKVHEVFTSQTTSEAKQPAEYRGEPVLRVASLLRAWSAGDAKAFAQFFHSQGEFVNTDGVSAIGPPQIENVAERLFKTPAWNTKTWHIHDVQLVAALVVVPVFSGQPGPEPQPGEMRLILLLKQFSQGWLLLKADLSLSGPPPTETDE